MEQKEAYTAKTSQSKPKASTEPGSNTGQPYDPPHHVARLLASLLSNPHVIEGAHFPNSMLLITTSEVNVEADLGYYIILRLEPDPNAVKGVGYALVKGD